MKQKILENTHGGLDIILFYYPQAAEVAEKRKKFFKIRDEKTASASLKEIEGVWYVCDFGDDGKGRNCFDVAMREENLPFSQVIHLLAQRYNIDFSIKQNINKPTFTSRPATADDPKFSFVKREPTEAELKILGPFVTKKAMETYHYFALESYSIKKEDKILTFTSNDNYPIFMHDCGSFQKIYNPLAYEKQYRFFYNGDKQRDYINGLSVVESRFKTLNSSENTKLEEVIICSGERDALNVAGMGFLPIWFNSETAEIHESVIAKLLNLCNKIYNIPDIDKTGLRMAQKLALQHLDIYTVELPEWLKTYKDNRGKPRKDLRDFLELRPDIYEFKKYLSTANQCRFWDIDEKGNYQIRLTKLLYFLQMNGFYKYKDPISKSTILVKIDGYRVFRYEPQEIRDFVTKDLRRRQVSNRIVDTFLNSKRTTTSLTNDLQITEINFQKSDQESRNLFFNNTAIQVFADHIETLDKSSIEKFIWNDEVSPYDFRRLEPSFVGTGETDFAVKNSESPFFRMLINTSRMFWQKDDPQKHPFAITSPLLSDSENREQILHLLNKIYAIGYQLHCQKTRSKALALWAMENKITAENESSGGSGKSIFAQALNNLQLVSITTLDGRNKRLTDNQHLLDRVSAKTDILLIDDACRYFDFDSFYSMITGNMTVNPKGEKSFEIKFFDAPTISVTSNFPMPNDDKSTMRRILPVVFSDYYHFDNGDGTYTGSWSPFDDFQKDLFGVNYTPAEYNADINFCVDCLQFYLKMLKINKIARPPMENIQKRMNIQKMGDLFEEWAEGYFSETSGRLNCLVNKQVAWRDFLLETGAREQQWKINRFTKALRAFVENYDLMLNPPSLMGYDKAKRRIMRKRENRMKEYIYIQQTNVEIDQYSFFDEPF